VDKYDDAVETKKKHSRHSIRFHFLKGKTGLLEVWRKGSWNEKGEALLNSLVLWGLLIYSGHALDDAREFGWDFSDQGIYTSRSRYVDRKRRNVAN